MNKQAKRALVDETQALEIVNTRAIKQLLASVEMQGSEVIVSPHAAEKIRNFKRALKLMATAEALLKDEIRAAAESFHARTIKGQDLSISVAAPRGSSRYALADGYKHEWGKQQVSYVPDVDRIEAYLLANGTLPEGVTLNADVKPTVTIRIKEEPM